MRVLVLIVHPRVNDDGGKAYIKATVSETQASPPWKQDQSSQRYHRLLLNTNRLLVISAMRTLIICAVLIAGKSFVRRPHLPLDLACRLSVPWEKSGPLTCLSVCASLCCSSVCLSVCLSLSLSLFPVLKAYP